MTPGFFVGMAAGYVAGFISGAIAAVGTVAAIGRAVVLPARVPDEVPAAWMELESGR